jgi:hypothetical protein
MRDRALNGKAFPAVLAEAPNAEAPDAHPTNHPRRRKLLQLSTTTHGARLQPLAKLTHGAKARMERLQVELMPGEHGKYGGCWSTFLLFCEYASRLIQILNILGDSENIGLAVCHADTRNFFEASFIEVHGTRFPLEN